MNCSDFCALACVDGSCPRAWIEEYMERGYDVIRTCEECYHSQGTCEDCIFEDTEYCVGKEGLKNGFN